MGGVSGGVFSRLIFWFLDGESGQPACTSGRLEQDTVLMTSRLALLNFFHL